MGGRRTGAGAGALHDRLMWRTGLPGDRDFDSHFSTGFSGIFSTGLPGIFFNRFTGEFFPTGLPGNFSQQVYRGIFSQQVYRGIFSQQVYIYPPRNGNRNSKYNKLVNPPRLDHLVLGI